MLISKYAPDEFDQDNQDEEFYHSDNDKESDFVICPFLLYNIYTNCSVACTNTTSKKTVSIFGWMRIERERLLKTG